jgi:hypothetical protein
MVDQTWISRAFAGPLQVYTCQYKRDFSVSLIECCASVSAERLFSCLAAEYWPCISSNLLIAIESNSPVQSPEYACLLVA